MLKSITSHFRRFSACTKGSTAIIFAFSAIPFFIASGAAIDYGRYTNTHHDIAMSLDAALMSAAAAIYAEEQLSDAELAAAIQTGQDFFAADIGDQSGATINDPVFTYDKTLKVLKANVTGKVDTNFLVVAGFPDLALNVNAQAVVGMEVKVGSDLEVTVMLDTTGSMGTTKMAALKTAAAQLIDEVVWSDQTKNTSKVALVPFAESVRLAKNGQSSPQFTAMTGLPSSWSGWVEGTEQVEEQYTETESQAYTYTDPTRCVRWTRRNNRNVAPCLQYFSETRYRNVEVTRTRMVDVVAGVYQQNFVKARPCVTERYYNSSSSFGLTDEAPGPGNWLNGDDGDRKLESLDSSDTAIQYNGKTKPNYLRKSGNTFPTLVGNFGTSGSCYGIHDNNVVMPLTNDVAALKQRISDLTSGGYTAGALGTAMAWYAISPNWADVWGGDSAPQSYAKMSELNEQGKPKLYKIAVLMTDGEYNFARANSSNVTTTNTAALALCTGMKEQGIEVYTVGFMTSSTADDLLEDCATDSGHFYSADDAAALQQAFKDIGVKVRYTAGGEIRLSQ
jgi:Mg-chelatase subunit ChlD